MSLRIKDVNVLGWIIIDSNETIKMAGNKHLDNASIINVECMTLRNCVLAKRDNCFVNLEIEGNSKVLIYCYNKKISLLNSIILLMKDVWRIYTRI